MRYELTDYEWTAIKPMLPNKPRGVPRVNDRRPQRHLLGPAIRGTLARFAGSFWPLHDLL
jgi:transposase